MLEHVIFLAMSGCRGLRSTTSTTSPGINGLGTRNVGDPLTVSPFLLYQYSIDLESSERPLRHVLHLELGDDHVAFGLGLAGQSSRPRLAFERGDELAELWAAAARHCVDARSRAPTNADERLSATHHVILH